MGIAILKSFMCVCRMEKMSKYVDVLGPRVTAKEGRWKSVLGKARQTL